MTGTFHARPDPADNALYVVIEELPVKNEYRSNAEGRPIFESELQFVITNPGGKQIVYLPVSDELKLRFPDVWAAWELRKGNGFQGTPLSEIRTIDVATEATYKALSIHTIEQLAAVSDAVLDKMGMGARENRAKAQAYLDTAKEQAIPLGLAAENERLKADIGALREQMQELQKVILEKSSQSPIVTPVTPVPSQGDSVREDIRKIFGA